MNAKISRITPNFLRGLLGKLLLAYVGVTFVAWALTSQAVGLYEYYLLRGQLSVERVAAETIEQAAQTIEYVAATPPNVAALSLLLKTQNEEIERRQRRLAPIFTSNLEAANPRANFAVITDGSGARLASSGDEARVDFRRDEHLKAIDSELLAAALGGESDIAKLARRDGEAIVAAAAIRDSGGRIRGALLVRRAVPLSWSGAFAKLSLDSFGMFRNMLAAFTATGLIFSFFVGRRLIERLKRIASAASAWSVGDFSARAADESGDEIGTLARRLNAMAVDLRDFFRLKQELAAARERNRLARDLHDSVKQQIFGLAMQIGAARALTAENTTAAGKSLIEAEKLASAVQQELVNLINELRPAVRESESLGERIKNYAEDWARQNAIAATINVGELPALAPAEEHHVFRIAQEALANVARHGAATKITLDLEASGGKIRLVIADNGRGFDFGTAKKGFGLQNMRERAESLPDGFFNLGSRIGEGTRIETGFTAKTTKENNGNTGASYDDGRANYDDYR